jgi:hypothetical protein
MRRPAAAVAAVFGAVVLLTPGLAQAKWTATGSGAATIRARTISNASGLGSACVTKPGPDDVTLTWTASPDSAIVSYVINRTGGAGAYSFASASGTTTVTDTNTDWPAASGSFAYTYTIRAVVGTAPWTTVASASTIRNFTKSGKCS